MKYVVVLGDGMADRPIESLGGKTPLEYADTPVMDMLSGMSEVGLVATIPEGMKPGSDTANLAVLGYDPKKYYTGRSPLEALSIGVCMEPDDIAIRCNVVTVSEEESEYKDKVIIDHSAGEITTEEAAELIKAVQNELQDDIYKYYVGTSYRHLTIWKGGMVVELTPPHDILGKVIGEYLPEDDKLREFMERSYDILNNHPINIEREKNGLNKANSLWFWGAGTKPALDSFEEKYNKKAAMISAVDLLKGIAIGANMTNIIVEGADGTLHTNYEGKAEAAVNALLSDGYDFVYIHVEAPDEMGHQGSVENKIKAIEYLDSKVIKIVYEKLVASGEEFRMLVMPDHATPICVRTHTSEPIPYMLYDSTLCTISEYMYIEKDAVKSASANDNMFAEGYKLMDYFLNN